MREMRVICGLMQRFIRLISYVWSNFGPLVAYFVTEHFYGARPAIIAAVAVSFVEILVFLARRRRPTMFFGFSMAVTLLFGGIDIFAEAPFLFKYEAAVTSVVFGLYFGGTILAGRPVIEEFAASTLPPDELADPNVRRYLCLLTGVWTAYFFGKAAFYLYLAETYPLGQAMAIRTVFGSASMAVLLVGERIFRTQIVALFRRCGWMPPRPALAPGAAADG